MQQKTNVERFRIKKKEMYKYLYHVECKNARTNADKKLEKTLFREIDNENVPFFCKNKI